MEVQEEGEAMQNDNSRFRQWAQALQEIAAN